MGTPLPRGPAARLPHVQVKADPVYLVDRKGRVAYSITVKSAFDEVMELHSFPFDKQVFDIRVYFEPTDKHTWRVVNHPFESNAWQVVEE